MSFLRRYLFFALLCLLLPVAQGIGYAHALTHLGGEPRHSLDMHQDGGHAADALCKLCLGMAGGAAAAVGRQQANAPGGSVVQRTPMAPAPTWRPLRPYAARAPPAS